MGNFVSARRWFKHHQWWLGIFRWMSSLSDPYAPPTANASEADSAHSKVKQSSVYPIQSSPPFSWTQRPSQAFQSSQQPFGPNQQHIQPINRSDMDHFASASGLDDKFRPNVVKQGAVGFEVGLLEVLTHISAHQMDLRGWPTHSAGLS